MRNENKGIGQCGTAHGFSASALPAAAASQYRGMNINYLGGDDAERQKNLALIKAWVGEGGWFLGRFKDLDKATLEKMKVAE